MHAPGGRGLAGAPGRPGDRRGEHGSDFLEALLRTVDGSIAYKKVNASRGKAIRAEPVSALYEQGRVHHVGTFAELEDELCTWTPADPRSPNRLDALVWGFSELRGLSYGSPRDIFKIVTCANQACRNDFSRDPGGGLIRTRCPRCGTPIPEQGSDGATAARPDDTAALPAAQAPQPGSNPDAARRLPHATRAHPDAQPLAGLPPLGDRRNSAERGNAGP